MAKEQENPEVQEQEQAAVSVGSSTEANGYPKTLTAKTREDLFAEVEKLKASAKDVTLSAGAVARNEQGQYVIQIDIIK